jgi:PAS domain S-box-containing protein
MTEAGEHHDTAEARLDRGFAITGRLAAAVAIVLGAAVLVGWASGLEWIENPLGNWPMAPSTALSFVMIGGALALSIPAPCSRRRRWGARALALVSAALALLLHPLQHASLDTALAFTLLSAALLALDIGPRRGLIPAEVLAVTALVLGALALCDYLYGAPQFPASGVQRAPVGMAIHTAVGLIVVALGVLCARTRSGLMALVANPGFAGRLVRRVLLIALVVPIIGFFAAWAQNTGIYDSPGASVIIAVGGSVVAVVPALRFGRWLARGDVEQRRSDDRLREERDREAAERAEAERARMAAIVRWTDDAIMSTTLDGIVVDWNRAAERMFGYTAEEMIDQPADRIVPEDRRAERDALIAKTIAGEPVVGFETVRVSKDGRHIPIALTKSVVRDSSGRVAGISAIERDISVLKQFQREREEWSAIVAHDLRQPASVIRFATGTLRELEGALKQRMLARIESACGRLDQMIEDLLDMSRIEAHRLVVRPTRLRVAAALEEVIDLAPDLARRCTVRLEDSALEMQADAGRFSQVVWNLLSNADKYSYPDTPIDVHVQRADGMVEFTVTNEGPGIEPEEIPLLFSRFARTRAARRGPAPGLGLGLYISSGLVEAQGGRMWAESIPGQRTSFHFTLPAAERS